MRERSGFGRTTCVVALLFGATALACLWDYDTLRVERQRFPTALELITGKFPRHTPEFYRWRIDDRLKRLKFKPNDPALLDDRAVAYDKLDQHESAIATAKANEAAIPGRYETAANLATFYFHAGNAAVGIEYVDKALKINPNAHFGREKYQKLLMEYYQSRTRGKPPTFPLTDKQPAELQARPESSNKTPPTLFLHSTDRHSDRADAIKAILGMMRFAKHDSPILLEALGTMLSRSNNHVDEKQLAARAFLKASRDFPPGPSRDAYRQLANSALSMQMDSRGMVAFQLELPQLEAEFEAELADADAWYKRYRQRELGWIAAGLNPEVEEAKLAEPEPALSGLEGPKPLSYETKSVIWIIVIGLTVLAAFVGGLWLLISSLLRIARWAWK